MKPVAFESRAPINSLVASRLAGSDFHDAWSIESSEVDLPALDHFMAAVEHTPRWINACMALRNRAVSLVGLKNIGRLSDVEPKKALSGYRIGERVGIFTLLQNTYDEVLLGDHDKHLNVVLSVHRAKGSGANTITLTVTTVVHIKNMLGRIYMLPVKPMHRIIVPAVLRALGKN